MRGVVTDSADGWDLTATTADMRGVVTDSADGW